MVPEPVDDLHAPVHLQCGLIRQCAMKGLRVLWVQPQHTPALDDPCLLAHEMIMEGTAQSYTIRFAHQSEG